MPRVPLLKNEFTAVDTACMAFLTVRDSLSLYDTSLTKTDILILSALLQERMEYIEGDDTKKQRLDKYVQVTDGGVWRKINPDYILSRYPLIIISEKSVDSIYLKLQRFGIIEIAKQHGTWFTVKQDFEQWVSQTMELHMSYNLVPQWAILNHPKLGLLSYKYILLCTYLAYVLPPYGKTEINAKALSFCCKWVGVEGREIMRMLTEITRLGIVSREYGRNHKMYYKHTPLLEYFKPTSKVVHDANTRLYVLNSSKHKC